MNLKIETINSLSISELDVLHFIDNNKQIVLDLSIQKLSKRLFVSTATIMRVCKKLGFSGFSEFKYYLREQIQVEEGFNQSITLEDVVKQHIHSINETAAMIQEPQILDIVQALNKAKRIHFFGKGLTHSVMSYTSKMLLTRGCANFLYSDTHIAYLAAEMMNEDDILFVASLSGMTHQAVRMAQIAKSRHAKIVVITANTHNELSKIGDYSLGISQDAHHVRPSDISSRLPMMFLLNVIMNLFLIHKEQIQFKQAIETIIIDE